ncbi:MAG: S1 RNA-binding domain-containing protein [Clostridiales bacterium]|nr:S1 RNA-binding domain-containing protein [Clostridiales bacterium]
MDLVIGTVLDGRVTGIAKFGAFVFLPEVGKSGMVHISEIANTYVNDIHEYVKEDQEVKVKVIGIDSSGKISLSIKRAEAAPASRPPASAPVYYTPKTVSQDSSFEDKLKQYMADAESSASAIRHHAERKRNSYRRG